MPGASRKIATAIFSLMLIGITAVAIYVLIQIQAKGGLAPTNSSAAGFGNLASRDLYPVFSKFFSELPCTQLLPTESIHTVLPLAEYQIAQATKDLLTGKTAKLTSKEASPTHPKNCDYLIGDSGTLSIKLDLFAYVSDSTIDDSAQELYSRVNQKSLLKQLSLGTMKSSIFFYGEGKDDTCVANLFHYQNDFERVTLTFTGFDCAVSKPYAEALVSVVSDYVFAHSKGISAKGFEKLCDGWARPGTERCDQATCSATICQNGEWKASPGSSICGNWGATSTNYCALQ